MTRVLMFGTILLLSVTWLAAQQDQANPSKAGSGSETTVQGCLQGSSGNFTLTDKAGTAYQLSGDTSKLTEHVGHEVQIKGTTSASSTPADSSSSNPSGVSAGGSQTSLTVKDVKHISKTCSSAAK
ncbi:MAG: hypothetical protein DMG80_10415 [Acidobacteria bacterium]|nr:MAG: hypothetical protein DMG80_10415 [Acidobacteriota bacterium]